MEPFRIPPKLPAHAMQTHQILQPLSSHFRDATCKEVDCAAFNKGWKTTIDTATELGAQQANYIRLHSGRHFTYEQTGTMVVFTFPAGQECFREHKVPLERPAIFIRKDGDFRGNPRGTTAYRHRNADDWVDEFANDLQDLKDRLERG